MSFLAASDRSDGVLKQVLPPVVLRKPLRSRRLAEECFSAA
jgi:hypothetical protein